MHWLSVGRRISNDPSFSTAPRTQTKERNHQCDICGKTYYDSASLAAHLKYHNKELFKAECYICKVKTVTMGDMRMHMRRHVSWTNLDLAFAVCPFS